MKNKNFNYGDTVFHLKFDGEIEKVVFSEEWLDGMSYITRSGGRHCQVPHKELFKSEDEAFSFYIDEVKARKQSMIKWIEQCKKDIEKCDEILKNAKTKSYCEEKGNKKDGK